MTGFTGFLGTEILKLLKTVDCEITGITRGEFKDPNIKIIRENLDDASLWNDPLQDTDLVFHLAAQTNLETAEKDPVLDHRVNVLPMLHLLQASKLLKKKIRVVFAGTATQAGIPESLPLDERHPDRSMTVYDVHKLEAENLLKRSSSRHEVSGVSLRLCNLYGPGPNPKSSERGILNQAVMNGVEGKTLFWYEGHDFIRDYLYVTDAARAFLKAGENAETLSGRHFVIGSGQGWKFSEAFQLAAGKIVALGGSRVEVHRTLNSKPLAPIHCRNVVADSRAFSNATGWWPKISLAEGLEKTAVYFMGLSVEKTGVCS